MPVFNIDLTEEYRSVPMLFSAGEHGSPSHDT